MLLEQIWQHGYEMELEFKMTYKMSQHLKFVPQKKKWLTDIVHISQYIFLWTVVQ